MNALNTDEGELVAARKAVSGPTTQVAIRIPIALLKRIDEHALRMEREQPGNPRTRVEAVRNLLARALDAAEANDKTRRGGK